MFGFGLRRELNEMKQRIQINDALHMETVRALARSEDIARLTERVLKLEAEVFVRPQAAVATRIEDEARSMPI